MFRSMKLRADWKLILRKAWSVRLLILAGALTGGEAVLAIFTSSSSPRWMPFLLFSVTMGALIARIVAQRDFTDEKPAG